MSKPFLIRHADGREYELSDPVYYRDVYVPHGFALVDPQPNGYERPDLSEKKAAKDGPAVKRTTHADTGTGDVLTGSSLHAANSDVGKQ